MPKLWNETIDAHRREVSSAILDTTAALVAEHGLRSVTMSAIAQETRIGRATLYKYFPSVEAILHAWHGQQIAGHLALLAEVRDRAGDPATRLEAVLRAYALIAHDSRHHHATDLGAFLHQDAHLAHAQEHLRGLVKALVTDAVVAKQIRNDIATDELVTYALHAVKAAASLPSKAAVGRLVEIILDGLRSTVDA